VNAEHDPWCERCGYRKSAHTAQPKPVGCCADFQYWVFGNELTVPDEYQMPRAAKKRRRKS